MKKKLIFYLVIIIFLLYYFLPVNKYIHLIFESMRIILEGKNIIHNDKYIEKCIYRDEKIYKKKIFSDCMKQKGKLKLVVYNSKFSIISAVYRCDINEQYIEELVISKHLNAKNKSNLNCLYSIFDKDLYISVGGATRYYTPL